VLYSIRTSPKGNSPKLDNNARKCVFVGYTLTTKQYKLYDPESEKVILSRNVHFDEKVPYFQSVQTQTKVFYYVPTTEEEQKVEELPARYEEQKNGILKKNLMGLLVKYPMVKLI
jgi:hypothetical protein